MAAATISILIPCYNEESTILELLQRVSAAECVISKEIVIVNDGSSDDTESRIQQFIDANPELNITLLVHSINKGKGASIRTGLNASSGNIVIIQDADLEYDPAEYSKMLKPILSGHADVVYGSRFRGNEAHRVLFFFHTIGNKFLTFLSNLFTGLNLSDMETGYKMFTKTSLDKIRLVEKRFGFEPEVTAKISRIKKIRIYEVGIGYYGRTYEDGKKIRLKDGFRAIYCIFKYNIFSRK